ncbi:MAG: tetratricopeptide repeat protein, partial [Oscillospiraceae bacterium]|nr:tetratricopeptide repeat protein [Oscillospiraceae bacterium]
CAGCGTPQQQAAVQPQEQPAPLAAAQSPPQTQPETQPQQQYIAEEQVQKSDSSLTKRLFELYSSPFAGFVFAGLLCVGFVPWAIKSLAVMSSGRLLSLGTPIILQIFCSFFAFVLIVFAELRRQKLKFRPNAFGSACVQIFFGGGGFAMAVIGIFAVANVLLDETFFYFSMQHPVWATIIQLGINATECALISVFAIKAFSNTLKKCGVVWGASTVLLLVGIWGVPLFLGSFPNLLSWTSESFSGHAAQWLIAAALQWAFIQPAFALWTKNERAADTKPNMAVGIGASAVLAGACVALIVTFVSFDPAAAAVRQVKDMLNLGYAYSQQDDYAWSAAFYARAEARSEFWLAALDSEEDDDLSYKFFKYNYDESIYLMLLSESESSQSALELYFKLATEKCPASYYILALEKFEALAKTDEKYQLMYDDILAECVKNGIFTGRVVTPRRLNDKQKKEAKEKIAAMEGEIDEGKMITLINKLALNGDILTWEMATEAIDFAEKYPDNIKMQWFGMQICSLYRTDGFLTVGNGSYSTRVAEAALRFDKLWLAENPSASLDEILNMKSEVALVLYEILSENEETKELVTGYFEDALVKYDNDAFRLLYAQALYYLQDFEKSAELAEELLKKNPDDYDAVSCAMFSQAMAGEQSLSIDYALKLSAAAQSGAIDPVFAGKSLFAYAQGASGAYAGIRKSFPWRYRNLSEEDKEKFAKDSLLDNLVQGLNEWLYEKNDWKKMIEHCDKALSLEPDWPVLQYFKASLLYQEEKFEEAAEWYEKSLAGDPDNVGTWFMLGNVYDKLERYSESISAFRKVLTFYSGSDHSIDHWGFNYHGNHAYDRLQRYLLDEMEMEEES